RRSPTASTTTFPSRRSTCRAPSTTCWPRPNPLRRRRSGMAETFSLEVATPERLVIREAATEAQIPAKNGYIGVLPGNAPLLSELGAGYASYVVEGRKSFLALNGGFVEVLPDKVRVLARTVEKSEEIDVQRAE